MRRPTLRDVAEGAGVHAATVSRALNPATRHLVSPETTRRVDEVAAALGYRVNPVARSLKTARSASIGLIVPDLMNPLFPPIVRGVEDVLLPIGYHAWIVNTDNDPAREAGTVEAMRARNVEGFVFATARLEHPLIEQLDAVGVPLVQVNRSSGRPDMPSVTPDDVSGVAMAMGHLVELGHRKIAHLAGPQDLSTGVTRLRAFRQALEDHGLEDVPERVVTCKEWSQAAGAEGAGRLFDSGAEFTAVLAGNDLLALGVYDVLAQRRLRCPQDVSVVGFNDIPLIDRVGPPLTSVRVPQYDIGAVAARLLLEELREPGRHPRSIVLPVELRVRGSTAAPA